MKDTALRFRLSLAVPLALGLAVGCSSGSAVVLTLDGETTSGGCSHTSPGLGRVCWEYFVVEATFEERGGEDAVVEDASIVTCTTSGCSGSEGPTAPFSRFGRHHIGAHGSLTLAFATLYAKNERPDHVRVTATVVEGDTRYRVQAETRVPADR